MAPGDPISPSLPSLEARSLPSTAVVAQHYGCLEGKVFLVTGASSGIGKACALALAASKATVFLACRAGAKAEQALGEARAASQKAVKGADDRVFLLDCDMGCPESVRRCAAAFLERGLPLHALINNAGVNGVPTWARDTPGVETQFAVNFLGPFELQQLLHQRLLDTKGGRVVNVASDAHARVTVPYTGGYVIPSFFPSTEGFELKSLLPPPEQGYDPLHAYAFSNLCRILWTKALAKRTSYPVVCLHPSNVAFTGMLQHMPLLLSLRQVLLGLWWDVRTSNPLQPLDIGARCVTWCAVAREREIGPLSGKYLSGNLDCRQTDKSAPTVFGNSRAWRGLSETSALAASDDLAEELFAFAETFVAKGRGEAIAANARVAGPAHGRKESSILMLVAFFVLIAAVCARAFLSG